MLFVEDLPIKIYSDKILLNIKVTPKASSNRIGHIINNSLKIYVTAAPEHGQANKFVINLLSEKLNINKQSINIMQGATSQNKVVELVGNTELIINALKLVVN